MFWTRKEKFFLVEQEEFKDKKEKLKTEQIARISVTTSKISDIWQNKVQEVEENQKEIEIQKETAEKTQ